ncbi:hypothetical protein DL96DRAFT_205951 [Flagelloscypha sp. PMI_526]|nr:hypothetical protein DL96DRAFT_205951 [Flagelloscypha sp. PMI_526]
MTSPAIHNAFGTTMLVSQDTGASLVPSFRSLPGDSETSLASQRSPLLHEEDPPEYTPSSFSGEISPAFGDIRPVQLASQVPRPDGPVLLDVLPSDAPSSPSAVPKAISNLAPEWPTPSFNVAITSTASSFPASTGALPFMATQSEPDLLDSPELDDKIPLDLGIPEDGRPARTSMSRRLRKMLKYLKTHLQCKKCEKTRYRRYGTVRPCSKCWSEYNTPYKGVKYGHHSTSSETFLPTYEESRFTARLVPPAGLPTLPSHSVPRYRSASFSGYMGPSAPWRGRHFSHIHPGPFMRSGNETIGAIQYARCRPRSRMNRSGSLVH